MSKLAFLFALACCLLFSGRQCEMTKTSGGGYTLVRRKCTENAKFEVVFKLEGEAEEEVKDLECANYFSNKWLHLHMGWKTENFNGYYIGCLEEGNEKKEIEVRCNKENVTAIQPRGFPKKNCVFHGPAKPYHFAALVEKNVNITCGILREHMNKVTKFNLTVIETAASESPSALSEISGNTDSSSGTSAASVLGGPKERDGKQPVDSVSAQGVNGAATAGRQEGVAATSPLSSAGSSGAQRDDAVKDPDVLRQLSEQHGTGEIGESGKGLREGVNMSDLLAQAASHSRSVRKYHLTLLSFFSLPGLLPGA
ncbi:hypothetical protein TRVL_03412 [Trypanosoma vivax]|nr:hypothetical protein TRVL_03412 [Trypanosoma vivax]